MKGENTLELNEATMIAAVQYWLESQFAHGRAPKVTRVEGKSTTNYSDYFAVTVKERSTDEPSSL